MSIVKPEHRGAVTPEASAIWLEMTGRELTTKELRLLPFLQSCVLNGGSFTASNVGRDNLELFSHWQAEGLLEYGPAQRASFGGDHVVGFTPKFWQAVTAILWETYAVKSIRMDRSING